MMKSTLALSLLALLPAALADLTVNTPSGVTECEPVLLTWTDGTAPYYLTLVPAGQPMAQPMKQWAPTQDTSMTWDVDLPANTNFNIGCKDGTGKQVFSALVTVSASADGDCKAKKDTSTDTAVLEGSPTGSGAGAAPTATGGESAAPMSLAASTSAPASGSATMHAAATTGSGSGTASHTGSSSSSSASATPGSHKANSAVHGSVAFTTVSGIAIAAVVGFVRFGGVFF